MEATKLRAYRYYEDELAKKNRAKEIAFPPARAASARLSSEA
jgi:hypothetical protein